MRTVGYT